MRFIIISDELYDYLARLARPGENVHHVIARALGFTGASFDDEAPILINGRPRGKWQRGWGSLKRFIEAGDFAPGDKLRITWPHRRQTLTVTVDRHGMLTDPDGTVHTSLAAAAEVVTGHKGSGPFKSWIHLPSGRSLAWWQDRYDQRAEVKRQQLRSDRSADRPAEGPSNGQR